MQDIFIWNADIYINDGMMGINPNRLILISVHRLGTCQKCSGGREWMDGWDGMDWKDGWMDGF